MVVSTSSAQNQMAIAAFAFASVPRHPWECVQCNRRLMKNETATTENPRTDDDRRNTYFAVARTSRAINHHQQSLLFFVLRPINAVVAAAVSSIPAP